MERAMTLLLDTNILIDVPKVEAAALAWPDGSISNGWQHKFCRAQNTAAEQNGLDK
jgi:hypothetical protein